MSKEVFFMFDDEQGIKGKPRGIHVSSLCTARGQKIYASPLNPLLIELSSDLVLQSILSPFQRDLGVIMKELERIRGDAWHLSRTYPQVKENIMERLTDVDECWQNLDKKFLERKARLSQAEQVQLYFNDCRELMYGLAP